MTQRQKYFKTTSIVAVRLNLETKGLQYRKWGGLQRAKRGDWLVDNRGEIYTVDAQSFAKTYRLKDKGTRGIYVKKAPVWAEPATQAGRIKTKEGFTSYRAGDFIVSNTRRGDDTWAIKKKEFIAMYKSAKPASPLK